MTKIPWPEYISLTNWSGALSASFPSAQIPYLEDEKDWQEWGAAVVGTGTFAHSGVPSPFTIKQGAKKDDFKDWQDWAKVVYMIMNNEIKK